MTRHDRYLSSVRAAPLPSPAAVYLLHRTDRQRFKVGWAFDPLRRAEGLPEFGRRQLDLRSSLAMWLSSRQRAQEVERALHKGLAPYRVPAGHRGDGHSEWFAPQALANAVRLLRQMPGAAASTTSSAPMHPLRPLLPDLASHGDDRDVLYEAPETTPQDMWLAVEDLWLRLAARLPVRVEGRDGRWRVVLEGFRGAPAHDGAELRMRALDVDTFAWRLAEQRGSLVQLIAYEGEHLVYTLTSLPTMARWPQGEDLGWQVQGFMGRMRAQAARCA